MRNSPTPMIIAEGVDRPALPPRARQRLRRTRRHPRVTQFDYLHLKYLLDDLSEVLATLPDSVQDAVDVFCGTRPYEDLLPTGVQCVGLDIDNCYGAADLTSHEFLPFEDESFDLVLCISGFYFVPDPRRGATEMRRVLRPGGTVVVTVPVVWEYDRTILEHRFTGPQLAEVFGDWADVDVIENGGRAIAWALLTGHLIHLRERALSRHVRTLTSPMFKLSYLMINMLAMRVNHALRRIDAGPNTLPANLLLHARKPAA